MTDTREDYEEFHGQPDDVNDDEYFERDNDVPDEPEFSTASQQIKLAQSNSM